MKHDIIQAQQCKRFTFEKYPESMGMDIQTFVDGLMEKFPVDHIASILHNQDVYTKDSEEHKKGELKKAHYHIYVELHSPQRTESVCKYIYGECDKDNLSHTPLFKVDNPSSLIKYFLHITDQAQKDHKHEYRKEEILTNSSNWLDLMLLVDGQESKKDTGEKEHEEFIQLFCDWLENEKTDKKASFIECYRKWGCKLDKKCFKWKDLVVEHNQQLDSNDLYEIQHKEIMDMNEQIAGMSDTIQSLLEHNTTLVNALELYKKEIKEMKGNK